MSKYSQISKEIGWEARELSIPSPKKAELLKELVIKRHCTESFKKALELHRFVQITYKDDDFKAMKFIYEAVEKGREIFERINA